MASRREATPRSARENFTVLARIRADFNEIERGFLWRNRWLELPTVHTHTRAHIHTRAARRSAVAATVAAGVSVRR